MPPALKSVASPARSLSGTRLAETRMLHDLVRHPAVEESLREMSDILGQNVRALDSEEACGRR